MDSVYDVACETRLGHDIAVVEVVIKSAFVFKYKQNIRLTLSDKISNIGKFNICMTIQIINSTFLYFIRWSVGDILGCKLVELLGDVCLALETLD